MPPSAIVGASSKTKPLLEQVNSKVPVNEGLAFGAARLAVVYAALALLKAELAYDAAELAVYDGVFAIL